MTSAVLVVDDDRATREVFERTLRVHGFEVFVAATGTEALRLARRPALDLIVSDLRLPDVTGLDILQQLRLELVDVPFVIVTGFASTHTAMEAGRFGAVEYLQKPVRPAELMDAVRCHARCRGRAPSSSHATHGAPQSHADRAVEILERRYADPALTVGSMAQSLGLSTEHLCRLIKLRTGRTFSKLLRDRRIRAAQALLATRLSVTEIAARVGFNSGSELDHAFKTVCARSPSQYRAASRQWSTSGSIETASTAEPARPISILGKQYQSRASIRRR